MSGGKGPRTIHGGGPAPLTVLRVQCHSAAPAADPKPRSRHMDATPPLTADPLRAGVEFSTNAKVIFEHAQALAERSSRAGVTSSCLLFAFAECAESRHDTARFVRDVLTRDRRYDEAFRAFLEDSGS